MTDSRICKIGLLRIVLVLIMADWTLPAGAQCDTSVLNKLYAEAWAFMGKPRPHLPDAPEHDPALYDVSREAIEVRETYWNAVLDQLNGIDPGCLQGQDRINFEMFRYIIEDEVATYQYKSYLMPFDAEGGFHTALGFLPRSQQFQNTRDVDRYLVKLEGFGPLVDQYIALMNQGIASGMTAPRLIMEGFDQTAEAYVRDTPEESIFYAPVHALPDEFEDRAALIERCRKAIAECIHPGYRKLASYLRDIYIPACRNSIGATALPNGREYYAQRIRYFTTTEMTPEEVFQLGMSEVTRIRRKMEDIITALHFAGSFADFLQFLRSDPQFYAQTPHQLLAEASYFSKRIDGKLPEYFNLLPRLPYGVAPVPDEIAPRYTAGRYVPGSYTDHRAGTYWVNTQLLESRPLYALPALTLHEAVPGHHLQISLAAEQQEHAGVTLPKFRTSYYISGFGEGWALYAEWLGHEMGIYEDLYQEFGALTYEMWRACRLVVDPGIHAMGWTRDEAIRFMAENTALSMHEVNTEINRYIGWPGQAVSYKTGEMKIRELRRRTEEKEGKAFDLRGFHDRVLANGSVPLFVLERMVMNSIE